MMRNDATMPGDSVGGVKAGGASVGRAGASGVGTGEERSMDLGARFDKAPAGLRGRAPSKSARLAALFVLTASLTHTLTASAQDPNEPDPTAPAEPGARGTFSGLFLGAELVMLAEAAAGVRPKWAYAVGGGAGAVGGAIAGFASDEAGNTPLSMGLFVGAVVLAVPTTIAVLSATAYRAPTQAETASTRQRGGYAQPFRASHMTTTSRPVALHVSPSPTSFLAEYHQQSLAIGVPDVKVSQVYSRLERATRRVPDATQVVVPLFRMRF